MKKKFEIHGQNLKIDIEKKRKPMGKFTIKVKDVEEYKKKELHMYASGEGKRFFIALHAGPNVQRYVVETKTGLSQFIKLGEAVKFFNES